METPINEAVEKPAYRPPTGSALIDRIEYLIERIDETQRCVCESGAHASACHDNLRRIAKDCLLLAGKPNAAGEVRRNAVTSTGLLGGPNGGGK